MHGKFIGLPKMRYVNFMKDRTFKITDEPIMGDSNVTNVGKRVFVDCVDATTGERTECSLPMSVVQMMKDKWQHLNEEIRDNWLNRGIWTRLRNLSKKQGVPSIGMNDICWKVIKSNVDRFPKYKVEVDNETKLLRM